MKKPNKILIIIQRSNGDVFYSLNLINQLFISFNKPQIDILVNDDTYEVAKLLSHIENIFVFSYKKKKNNKWSQELNIIRNIFRRYDLSINLTASDRSVLYSVLASGRSVSSIEKNNRKSWWKKILLDKFYFFDDKKHILLNNLEPLNLLKINYNKVQTSINISKKIVFKTKNMLNEMGIKDFIIFHPSAQYSYKIYPEHLRNKLLYKLNDLGLPILITGTNNEIDTEIKKQLPSLSNIIDMIGKTSLEEYFALSYLSRAFIGMDTLNMHIASSQNKRIFAIFGPSKLSAWSPWSNDIQQSAKYDKPIQTYGNITIFQADMPCVACGKAGCDNSHGKSDCLYNINPQLIFNEVKNWLKNVNAH